MHSTHIVEIQRETSIHSVRFDVAPQRIVHFRWFAEKQSLETHIPKPKGSFFPFSERHGGIAELLPHLYRDKGFESLEVR